jgi:hypothetical protein
MKLSTLFFSTSLVYMVSAELDLHVWVPIERKKSAKLYGKQHSDGIVKEMIPYRNDYDSQDQPFATVDQSLTYGYFTTVEFSDATTIPRPINITLFDGETPRYVSCG